MEGNSNASFEENFEGNEEKTFGTVGGFSRVDRLGGNEPSTVAAYQRQGLTGAEPGRYAQNNGTLAMVTSSGEIHVWIPKSDPKAPREVSFEQAVRALKNAGYEEGSFYVPFSN